MLGSFLMILYGVMTIFQPNLFTDNLEIYANISLDELKVTQQKLVQYIDRVVQLNGGLNIVIGLAGFVAVYKSFIVKENWLLLIIFFTNILGYLTPMTFDQITGVIRYPEIMEIISFMLSAIAFLVLYTEVRKERN